MLLAAAGAGLIAGLAMASSQAADLGKVPMLREGAAAPSPWKRYNGWNKATWDSYNTLADLTKSPPPPKEGDLRPADAIRGDPEKGRALAFSRERGGGCVACHVMGPKTGELPGNVGPDLSEIGASGRDDSYLYNYVYDPRAFNPESVMPPWGAHGFYSEEEIRHIVAFLKTLTTPAKIESALDDPARRPLPVEDRDWQDPFVNPAAEAMENGVELFEKAGPTGKACASCHADPQTAFKRWAVAMPKFDSGMNRMIGVGEFIYRHGAATTGERWLMQSPENTRLVVWLHALSNGEAIAVDTESEPAKQALARGARLYNAKIGQANFACVDCHGADKGANKWIRGQWLGEARGQIGHFPVWRTSRNETWDIRRRFQWCNIQIRANELPPDAPEYGDLELFVTAASKGQPMEAPGIRH